MEVNQERLNAFMGKVLTDVGAATNAPLIRIGDKLGIYKALAAKGSVTPKELADATGTAERYIREWLAAQAASGYVDYDPATKKFSMNAEQAMVFADEESPVFLGAVGDVVSAMVVDEPKIADAFRTGKGVGWNERSECLFCGTARFFRTPYKHHLVQEWLPALDGVVAKLERGAMVADVGCGHGISTMLMARAFPKSQFRGFDAHPGSIDAAKQMAAAEGATNTAFSVDTAKTFPAGNYDLVCFFDCLHDMGDPVGALKHVRETIAPDGNLHAGRAVRERSPGGQSQSCRARVLRCLHHGLHAGITGAGGRPCARRAGRGGAAEGGRGGCRLHALPPRDRDAVQLDPRGAAVSPCDACCGGRLARAPSDLRRVVYAARFVAADRGGIARQASAAVRRVV